MSPRIPTTIALTLNDTIQLNGKEYKIQKELAKTLNSDVYLVLPNKPQSLAIPSRPKVIKGFTHLHPVQLNELNRMVDNESLKANIIANELDLAKKREAKILQSIFQGRGITSSSIPGSNWVKMKCLSTVTLSDWITNNAINSANFLTIALSLCYEIAMLHEFGIHRDIKSKNITVADHDMAHLIDFGAFLPKPKINSLYGSPGYVDNIVANKDKTHTHKDDVLALSIVLLQTFLKLNNNDFLTVLAQFISDKICYSTDEKAINNYLQNHITRENILNAITDVVDTHHFNSSVLSIYTLLINIIKKPEEERESARELLRLFFDLYQSPLVPIDKRHSLLMTCVGDFLQRSEQKYPEAKSAFEKYNQQIKQLKKSIDTMSQELDSLLSIFPELNNEFTGNTTPLPFEKDPQTLMSLRGQISDLSPFYRTENIAKVMDTRFEKLRQAIQTKHSSLFENKLAQILSEVLLGEKSVQDLQLLNLSTDKLPLLLSNGEISVKSIHQQVTLIIDKIISSKCSPFKDIDAAAKQLKVTELAKKLAPTVTYQVKKLLDLMPLSERRVKYTENSSPTSAYNRRMFWEVIEAQVPKDKLQTELSFTKTLPTIISRANTYMSAKKLLDAKDKEIFSRCKFALITSCIDGVKKFQKQIDDTKESESNKQAAILELHRILDRLNKGDISKIIDFHRADFRLFRFGKTDSRKYIEDQLKSNLSETNQFYYFNKRP